ncbi:sensor histidine kinase [Rhizobium sp. CF142]|uniref:sensor histidine kinase n=1 Tax=Rhizobium sp. CF142 TaxID=1144314 RepID=UPI00026EF7F7|nr:ATP-binding protein [Rhizobium sp. CF142]EJJ28831.1 histidine kinase [Rhizobium sp. CF142]
MSIDASLDLARDSSLFHSMPIGILRLSAKDAWKVIVDLRATEKRSGAFELNQDVSCALGNACLIAEANPSACVLLQVKDPAAIAKAPIASILSEDTLKRFTEGLHQLFRGQNAIVYDGSLTIVGGGEHQVAFNLWQTQREVAQDDIYLSFSSLRERISLEQAKDGLQSDLARSARVSLLGEMTASIAHEVNQPLGTIVASAEAGLRWLSRDEPDIAEVKLLLERITKNGKRAANVIATMRALASNKKSERLPTDINSVIEETILLLRTDFAKRQVTLRLDLSPTLPPVKADKTQILQVIVNLALNAAQAMADGQAWNRTLCIRTRRDGADVMVDVEDSGPGIDLHVRERLFESFFSTKETGIGMGLAICRSIIEAHGSRIELQSTPHLGARFSFALPAEHAQTNG